MKKVDNYAMQILAEHGCDCYTYGNCASEQVMEDLKEAYPKGMEFPYIEVANAILNISRPRPIVRAPWRLVWETDDDCDGIDFNAFAQAKGNAEDLLVEWMSQTRQEWKDVWNPTDDELDDYNYMIVTCSVSVHNYDPNADEYAEFWSPTQEELEKLGWKELTRDDIENEWKGAPQHD